MSQRRQEDPESTYQGFLLYSFHTSRNAGGRQLMVSKALRYLAEQALQRGHFERLGIEHDQIEEYRFTDLGWTQAETWERTG